MSRTPLTPQSPQSCRSPRSPRRSAGASVLTGGLLAALALAAAVAGAPGAAADAENVPPAGSSPVCAFYDGDGLTVLGDQGDRAFQVQCMLANRRYLPWDAVDGTFGLRTLDAVRRFQADHPPLLATGLVDADTWAALWRGDVPVDGAA
ncbi:peptidoglycan-binding domain-containing protein [Streptomyces drozdowiczii]|uniref:Peptidoglycan-binding protein n=1 Tax=Streptomyces drozdowiczii TaxID=202862 RepID=A0ABY6PWY0_9ACTN|nr:peptidoglycan-binding domain-containing protein [Streptomyces drozdowiczii]MCX0243911.1 peptidoglycan-binding protein [Streptomyces drozdowiczii]UZK56239.1 peptidoglycan-binding protein [Streptomyces drozdowiczii]